MINTKTLLFVDVCQGPGVLQSDCCYI